VAFKAKNVDILKKALEALKYNYKFTGNVVCRIGDNIILDLDKETVTTSSWNMDRVNTLKRKYSEIVVEEAAKRHHWAMQKNGNHIELRRY
jgi:hypothetical protein